MKKSCASGWLFTKIFLRICNWAFFPEPLGFSPRLYRPFAFVTFHNLLVS